MRLLFKIKKSDIVLFDACNQEVIVDNILQGFDYFVLDTRGESIVFNYRLLFGMAKNLRLDNIFNIKKVLISIKCSYFITLVDLIAPRVILTFMDNNPYFHVICRSRKSLIGVAIQNGVRTHYNLYDKVELIGREKYYIPYYFVHGHHTKVLYDEYDHESKKIFPVGSIKLDAFCKRNREYNVKYQLCLVSTWINGEEFGDYPFSTVNSKKVHKLIADVISDRSYSLVIALKTDTDEELSYYKAIFGDNVTYKKGDPEKYSSYVACFESKIVLSTYSTLGFEIFSIGKNVIFFNVSGDTRYSHNKNTITSCDRESLINLINRMLLKTVGCEYFSKRDEQCVQNSSSFSLDVIKDFLNNNI